jgi:PAS domain S-box-containing protein
MILAAYWPHLLAVLTAILLISFFALRASILNRRLQGSMAELSQRTDALNASREALQIERDNLSAIFEAMEDDVYIAGPDGGILYMNSALEKDFGPCDGRACFEYLYDRTDPCPWCRIPDVSAGKTVRREQYFPESGKTYDIIETPLRKANGIVKLTIFRDMTERSRAEDALRESRELLNAIVEGTSDAVFVKDAEGRFLLFNSAACRNTGRSAEEVLGRDVTSLFSAEEARVCMEMDRALMADPRTVTYEEEFSLNGERRVFLTTKGTVTDEHGAASGIFGISREITELRRMEAERLEMERRLLHSQKLESLGVLAGGIAHDFNNLLAVILGNLDMTRMRVPADSPAQHNIEAALKACQRSAKLIGQMLDYAGKGRFVLKGLDLNEIVHENVSLFRTSVGRNIELAIATTPDLPGIRADHDQIQQVIMNLIINAAEAIGSGPGVITVGTGLLECDADCLSRSRVEEKPSPGGFVCLEVSDTGCGMDEETQARLFEPFYTTKFMGRGLGMSAVLGIVRAHGGAILLESSEGSGAHFRVLFPVMGEAGAGPLEIADPGECSGGRKAGTGTVLVVDDEQEVRDLCMEIVEFLGFRVVGAADGNEALRIFSERTAEIDLVVLDMTMPNMDGVRALEGLRRIRPDVDVIISSGFSEENIAGRFTVDRPSGFIQKPFKVEELREILFRVSRSRSVPHGVRPEKWE